jgi:hypothetical protein
MPIGLLSFSRSIKKYQAWIAWKPKYDFWKKSGNKSAILLILLAALYDLVVPVHLLARRQLGRT